MRQSRLPKILFYRPFTMWTTCVVFQRFNRHATLSLPLLMLWRACALFFFFQIEQGPWYGLFSAFFLQFAGEPLPFFPPLDDAASFPPMFRLACKIPLSFFSDTPFLLPVVMTPLGSMFFIAEGAVLIHQFVHSCHLSCPTFCSPQFEVLPPSSARLKL